MKDGCQCSYQYHERKVETIISVSGELTIVADGEEITLNPGETFTVLPFVKHRMKSKNGDAVYLECSTSDINDVVRLEDDYQRA